ncbi:MAG TPA: phage holin family protein [Gemmatimonadaceae bacterium]|nr:phage holin family protein [Gemmatimonadaceae bacterium]
MGVQRMPIDPDIGIPDLISRLGDDSKRLLGDEVRLAKLEVKDNLKGGVFGVMWLGIAFGVGVVAMVAFTMFVATLIGRLVAGHMWLGAMVAAVIDLALGALMIKKGFAAYAEPSYTLEQTRSTLH